MGTRRMALASTAAIAAALVGAIVAGASVPAVLTSPDTTNHSGVYASIALDSAGHPVVAHVDLTDSDLRVVHCNDANCAGNDEAIATPITSGAPRYSTVTLDSAGNPVVSFYDANTHFLTLLHCNDADCLGGDESITTPDTLSGRYGSIELDSSGNPVVSYSADFSYEYLKVMHCNDSDCAGGDESITIPAPAGWDTSLALNSQGRPVISYYDPVNADLQVLTCGNANCVADNVIASPDTTGDVGRYTSLRLDGQGRPVVAYYDGTNGRLKILRCGNASCTSGNTIVSPDPGVLAGVLPFLVLDSSGRPVVSYYDDANDDLRLLLCGNATCASGNSIVVLDTAGDVGRMSSVAFDALGRPVAAYYDATNGDLKVAHCYFATCGKGGAVGGVTGLTHRAAMPRTLPSAHETGMRGLLVASAAVLGSSICLWGAGRLGARLMRR